MKKIFPLLALILLGCNEAIEIDPDTGFEIFTIDAGTHASIVRSETFIGTGIKVTALFDDSAMYTLQLASNQADINKLVGFSDCGQHHQSESARFGWRWYEDELQILAYSYNEGNLSHKLMGAISLNQEVNLTINIEAEQYLFMGDGLETVTLPRTANCESGDNYWLWPYFGGDEAAPHTVEVRLKRTELE
ncbi:MAG: hypothetical protein HEP71_01835 [Roseivirga sp.]|nr:hypothetical protein [Roseivirga sp.]